MAGNVEGFFHRGESVLALQFSAIFTVVICQVRRTMCKFWQQGKCTQAMSAVESGTCLRHGRLCCL